jgi:hypothetical protein
MHRSGKCNRSLFVVAIVAAVFSGSSFAAGESAPEEFRVTVYRDQRAVDEMRFADAAALEGWIKTRRAQVRAPGAGQGDSSALTKPFLPEAAYLETDAQGRSIMP